MAATVGSKKGSKAAGSSKGGKKPPPAAAAGRGAVGGDARRSASALAQLSLPVSRIANMVRKGRYAPAVSKLYVVKLTGILEFVTAELLLAALEKARARKKQRVTPRDFMLAVKDDEEFSALLKNVQISDAGVAPKPIHDLLRSTTRGGKKPTAAKEGSSGGTKKKKTAAAAKGAKGPTSAAEEGEEEEEEDENSDEDEDAEEGDDGPEDEEMDGDEGGDREVSQDY